MKKVAILIISVLITTFGCIKDNAGDCYQPPVPFRMQILDKSTDENLISNGTYDADSILIYGYDSLDVKKGVPFYFTTFNNEPNVIISQDLPVISSEDITKTFYIYYDQYDTDTLYVNVEQTLKDNCTYFPYIEVKINGVDMELDNQGYTFLLKK